MTSLKTLIKTILNVNAVVEDVTLEDSFEGAPAILIDVRPRQNAQPRCPVCGRACPRYDNGGSLDRIHWRAPDLNGIRVFLRCLTCRVSCPEHGVHAMMVPWAFPNSRFTKDFDHLVAWFATRLPKSTVAEYLRIDWKTVGRCISRVHAELEPDMSKRLDGLVHIGVDETSYRKGHSYITVVVNHDTNTVVWAAPNHGKSVFSKFFEALTPEQRASIKVVSGDGARWIDECMAAYIPDAKRCVDPFHVVCWATDVVDEVRRQSWRGLVAEAEQLKKLLKEEKEKAKEAKTKVTTDKEDELQEQFAKTSALATMIKKSQWTLAKRSTQLTDEDLARLEQIHNASPELHEAYTLKDNLRSLLKTHSPETVAALLPDWIASAKASPIEEISKLGEKIERHTPHILDTLKFKLSNARIEATNNKIKLIIRKAYGFRDVHNLLDMVLLVCSDIKIPLPNIELKAFC